MIITKTPFRMSFFGGGTDMPEFFREHGGAVISTSFDKYCYVNVRHLPPFFDYYTELSYAKTERVVDVNDIEHPAIREAMKLLGLNGQTPNRIDHNASDHSGRRRSVDWIPDKYAIDGASAFSFCRHGSASLTFMLFLVIIKTESRAIVWRNSFFSSWLP